MDEATIRLLTHLAPDLMDEVLMRAIVLERISIMQPVGRRALAQRLMLTEREIRALTDGMRKDGLVEVTPVGMELSDKAYQQIDAVRELVRSRLGFTALETQLQRLLHVDRVLIAPENVDENPQAITSVGRLAAGKLRQLMKSGMSLAVSGGTTLKSVADELTPGSSLDIEVLPARGGVGTLMETQASTIAEAIAHKLGARYRTLHITDTIGQDALRELMKLPEIREPLDALKHADVLLYGIARIQDMAQYRNTPRRHIDELVARDGVAEALGYCFDREGNMIEAAGGLGLPIDEIANIPTVIAVAAGSKKAEAILSVTRHHKNNYLILDASAARALADLMRESK